MGKSKKRRNEKQDKRRKQSALKKKQQVKNKIRIKADERRKKEYPVFNYFNMNEGFVSERFIKEIKKVLNRVRFDDRSIFDSKQQRMFRDIKKYGFAAFNDKLLSEIDDEHERFKAVTGLSLFFTKHVYGHLADQGSLEDFIPYNNVAIFPERNDFVVMFDGLNWKKTPWGKIYYSDSKPKVKIDGAEYTVAFSRHAAERIGDRCVDDPMSPTGAGIVFQIMKTCVNFDVVETDYNGKKQYFLTFFENCYKGFSPYNYVTEVLEDYDPTKQYYYRVGYCPIGFYDDFVSAITLLAPGMRGTPEHRKMQESDLKFSQKKHFDKLINLMTQEKNYSELSNFAAVKWFHKNGIPQVIELDEDPYGKTIDNNRATQHLTQKIQNSLKQIENPLSLMGYHQMKGDGFLRK